MRHEQIMITEIQIREFRVPGPEVRMVDIISNRARWLWMKRRVSL